MAIIGYFSIYILCLRFKTKRLLMFCCVFSALFIGCQGILVVKNQNNSGSFATGIIIVSMFQFLLMLYSLELMPTPLRCIGIGFMHSLALVGIIITYFVAGLISQFLLILATLILLYPIILLKLQETGGLPLKDFTSWTPL